MRCGYLVLKVGAERQTLASRSISVTKCSLWKYGFRASGVRTGPSADRAETGLLPRFLSSVLKRPSQEVRRELASGERFSGLAASCQSTGLPQKPQETCHSARRTIWRRARLACELAEEVLPDTNGLQAGALGNGASQHALPYFFALHRPLAGAFNSNLSAKEDAVLPTRRAIARGRQLRLGHTGEGNRGVGHPVAIQVAMHGGALVAISAIARHPEKFAHPGLVAPDCEVVASLEIGEG